MDLNSINDVNALIELQKIDKIREIEKKIHRLSFAPAISAAMILAYFVWASWYRHDIDTAGLLSINGFVVIASAIASVGGSNVQRTDLLMELFELKYEKQLKPTKTEV